MCPGSRQALGPYSKDAVTYLPLWPACCEVSRKQKRSVISQLLAPAAALNPPLTPRGDEGSWPLFLRFQHTFITSGAAFMLSS